MHRIDTPTAQKDKFGQGKNGFTNGDPATGRRATDLNSDMWDAVRKRSVLLLKPPAYHSVKANIRSFTPPLAG